MSKFVVYKVAGEFKIQPLNQCDELTFTQLNILPEFNYVGILHIVEEEQNIIPYLVEEVS